MLKGISKLPLDSETFGNFFHFRQSSSKLNQEFLIKGEGHSLKLKNSLFTSERVAIKPSRPFILIIIRVKQSRCGYTTVCNPTPNHNNDFIVTPVVISKKCSSYN